MFRNLTIVLFTLLVAACSKTDSYDPARDYFTYANTEQFVTRHLVLDLDVNFDKQSLIGTAELHLDVLDSAASRLVLDSRDISVEQVLVHSADKEPLSAQFSMGERDDVMGTPLSIDIPEAFQGEASVVVSISYFTDPGASALMWLPAELTAGGEYPMVFSQSQAIHARSWIPLQDTPAIRLTYEATIRTPESLLAVMSADNDPEAERDGEFYFQMPQPIPSYLIALAAGNIYFAPLGDETGVYSEPELLEASAYEFADLQAMLEVAEEQFGDYRWGRYDLLVLPPSFPYGGMENPRLSFLTPSLLAGDRSLVSVVAHELAHSWSGNLVTNATWRDGWLNEGMTSYLESRLMETIYSADRVDEERVLNYEELMLNFDSVPISRQGLAPRLDSGDADDVQGTIHYHKGQLFLEYLEEAFGREKLDKFLLTYFDEFAFKTITSEAFVDYLDEELLSKTPGTVNREQVNEWLYEPGLPQTAPNPSSATLSAATQYANGWAQGEVALDDIPAATWSSQAIRHFINSLPADLSDEQLAALDGHFGFSDTRNAEIGRTWFIQVAKRRYEPAYAKLELHLNRFGRTRLLAVVYQALAENGEDLMLAKRIFADAKHAYHPITVNAIERAISKAESASSAKL